MTTYTLKVMNNSGFNKNYVFFMQAPLVTSTGADPQVFTNAWVTFTGVRPGSTDTVNYTDETYAYWATAMTPIGPGSSMGQSGQAPANTATNDSVTFFSATDGALGFGPVSSPGSAMKGSLEIIAQADFTASNGYLFGLARPGNIPNNPSPVATFVAEPNDTYNITPVIKFFVADESYVPGAIIDLSKASTKAGAIDFTGRAQTTALATHEADGSFSIAYF